MGGDFDFIYYTMNRMGRGCPMSRVFRDMGPYHPSAGAGGAHFSRFYEK
jgi:hypothetical protein